MKKLLPLLFLMPFAAQAQMVDSTAHDRMFRAGRELRIYNRNHSAGTAMMIAGAAVSVAGSSNNSNFIMIGGGAVSLIGMVIELASHRHIAMAGIYLQGSSVVLPISGKRKRSVNK